MLVKLRKSRIDLFRERTYYLWLSIRRPDNLADTAAANKKLETQPCVEAICIAKVR